MVSQARDQGHPGPIHSQCSYYSQWNVNGGMVMLRLAHQSMTRSVGVLVGCWYWEGMSLCVVGGGGGVVVVVTQSL